MARNPKALFFFFYNSAALKTLFNRKIQKLELAFSFNDS